jgi:hypothetical protein
VAAAFTFFFVAGFVVFFVVFRGATFAEARCTFGPSVGFVFDVGSDRAFVAVSRVGSAVEGTDFVLRNFAVASLGSIDAAFDAGDDFALEIRFFAPEDGFFAIGFAAAFVVFFVVFVVNL